MAGSTASTDSAVAAVCAAVAPHFDVMDRAVARRRRTLVDTPDWRLHRRGMLLEAAPTPAGMSLLLTGPDGERHDAHSAEALDGPLLPTALPVGALRDRVIAVAGLRALLPLVQTEGRVHEVSLLDGQQKTVVRLVVEAPARARATAWAPMAGRPDLPVGSGLVPARILLMPVRGYLGRAAQVRGLLRRARLGVDPAAVAETGFTAAGLVPGMLPGVVDPPPTAHSPADATLAAVLAANLEIIEANVDGVVEDVDTEFLHDLRIAVRRSRSALKLAGDVLPAGTVATFAPQLRWLGDVTTPMRDLDVHLLDVPAAARRLQAYEAVDLDFFHDHLARHRTRAQRALARSLRSARYRRFVVAWRECLDAVAAQGLTGEDSGAVTAGELAAARIAKADRRVVRLGSQITPESPAEQLHTLRKRAKELRYVLELFAPVLDQLELKAVVADLKALQDCLGAFQDSHVQREAIHAFAAAMVAEQSPRRPVPVSTLLAMGELAARLSTDQEEARGDFERRFARFVRPTARQHMATLTRRASREGAGEGGDPDEAVHDPLDDPLDRGLDRRLDRRLDLHDGEDHERDHAADQTADHSKEHVVDHTDEPPRAPARSRSRAASAVTP